MSTDAAAGQAMPFSAHAALRKPRSNGALCATRTAPRANSRNAGQHRADPGRRGDHHRGDAGQHADVGRDLAAGVDQGLELAEHLAAADLDRADLGDRAVLRGAAGRLEVDDDERDVGQRRAELVDRDLLVARAHGAVGERARGGR